MLHDIRISLDKASIASATLSVLYDDFQDLSRDKRIEMIGSILTRVRAIDDLMSAEYFRTMDEGKL